MTSASCTEPPGCATKETPTLAAWSSESRKGKKASDASETPESVAIHAAFSSSVSGAGGASKFVAHSRASTAVMSPSM